MMKSDFVGCGITLELSKQSKCIFSLCQFMRVVWSKDIGLLAVSNYYIVCSGWVVALEDSVESINEARLEYSLDLRRRRLLETPDGRKEESKPRRRELQQ